MCSLTLFYIFYLLHMRYIWNKSVKLTLIIYFAFDFLILIATVKMPRQRLFTRSVLNKRPINMTLNLECTEEPLSEAQLISRTKFKENYDRVNSSAYFTLKKYTLYIDLLYQVAAILEELVKDHGGKLVCQAGVVSGYQYTL